MMGTGARTATRAGALTVVVGALFSGGAHSLAAPESDETCDPTLDEAAIEATLQKSHDAGESYEVLPDVNLPEKVEERIKIVAEKFHKATGKSLVVTSGTRSAAGQAEVIFDKLAAGDDVVKLYKNKTAALELKRIYDAGKAAKEDRGAIVDEMTDAIRAQIKKGVFISAHLRAGAADVRSTDMTTSEKHRFVEATEVGGLSVMLESTPPHFHLQLE
jgi:hypothetical protein